MGPKKRSSGSSNKNYKRQDKNGNPHQLDPVFGQHRALPISPEKLNSITPTTIPTDAETYLAMVRKQSESSSPIMFIRKEIDYDNDITQVKITIDESNSQLITESVLDEIIQQYELDKSKLPDIGDLDIPSNFEFPNNFTEWRKFVMTNEPETALISNFDHELAIKLIIYCTRWLSNSTPKQISTWIYALLIRVSQILESKEVSIVRDLGIKAKKFIKREGIDEVTNFTMTFIIAIASRVYGQRDLESW